MPEPDYELESLKDFKSSQTGNTKFNASKKKVMVKNFEQALISAARSNFSVRQQKPAAGFATVTAE